MALSPFQNKERRGRENGWGEKKKLYTKEKLNKFHRKPGPTQVSSNHITETEPFLASSETVQSKRH